MESEASFRAVILKGAWGSDFACQGTFSRVWRRFDCHTWGWGGEGECCGSQHLVVEIGDDAKHPEVCTTGQPPTMKSYPAGSVRSAALSLAWYPVHQVASH